MNDFSHGSEELGVGLDSLVPEAKPKRKNVLIREHFEKIDAALKRGVTFEQIREYLDGKGVNIGLTTLRQYISEARAKAAKPSSKRKREDKPKKPRHSKKTATAHDNRPATDGTDDSDFVHVDDKDL